MDLKKNETVDWYVIFCKSNHNHWINNWLDPYFQHCYLARKTKGGYMWIIIKPKWGFTSVKISDTIKYPEIRDLCGRDDIIVRYKAIIKRGKKPKWWATNYHLLAKIVLSMGMVTCVDQIKTFLGIDEPSIWTPFELYNHIKKGV